MEKSHHDQSSDGTPSVITLRLTLPANQISNFFSLLQRGFRVKVQVGFSIHALLTKQFGLNPEYIKERIKTLFLDGKPIDDLDIAVVKDGSFLALSAAMPGLAGATLRRGGPLASFRSQIHHEERGESISPKEGFVYIRIFNLLIPELGPIFLKRGVFISPEDFEELRKNVPGEFWRGAKEARVDGEKIAFHQLRGMDWSDQPRWILLFVNFGSDPA